MKNIFSCVVCRAVAAAFIASSANAADKVWVGATSSLASEDSNWQDGAKPATGDNIVMAGAVDMTWDIDDVIVGDWTQDGYTGTVTFETGETDLTANGVVQTVHGVLVGNERILKIDGDLVLRTGSWAGKDNPKFSTNNNAKEPAMTSGRGIYRLIVDVAGSAEIGADAAISVVGKGFRYTQSRWGTFSNSGAGGSHGGCGHSSYSLGIGESGHAPRHCYGSIRCPVTIGSCGGDYAHLQTLPGGAIRLKVGGLLTLDGKLDANAVSEFRTGQTSSRAVGSGGSVWVTAAGISGTGTVSANGWRGTNFGPSGGGRISICLTGEGAGFSDFSTENITAYGGYDSESKHGSAGTIYLETPDNKADGGELWVKGGYTCTLNAAGRYGTELWTGLDEDDFAFSKIVLANNVSLRVSSGLTISARGMDGENSAYNQMRLYNDNFALTGTEPVRNVNVTVCTSGTVIGSPLYLGEGARFLPNFATTVNGDVTLTDGANITHWENGSSDNNYRVNLRVAGDMSIDAASSVNVSGKGYTMAVGPGKPGISNCASGHGGMPGNPGVTSVCYGSFKEPTMLGSGSSHTTGGGAVDLVVDGTLTVNGSISARGSNQVLYPSAGGSVRIKAGRIAGSGSILANGGDSNGNNSYSSGGGRIAVTVNDDGAKVSDFTGSITAYGGKSKNFTTPIGGAGTIYLRDAGQDADSGMLIIDNGRCKTSGMKTVLSGAMSDETVGTVVITNNAQLLIENNRTLAVKGDWTALGCSAASIGAAASGTNAAGKVIFAGAGTSVISGTNFFTDVACTSPGKTLRFGTHDTLTRIDGEMTLAGGQGNPVTLCSIVPGTRWALNVAGASNVSFADVSDSDAGSGKTVTATDSTDGGNNANWTFIAAIRPGAAIAWKTTAASSDWADASNWEDENGDERVPVETDFVTVPSGCANGPVLPGATTLAGLTVAAGAAIGFGGFDLTVTESLTAAGTLNFSGTETLRLQGDADLTGAAMSMAPAQVMICGEETQTVDFAGLAFSKVTLANGSGGTAAKLTGGFTAKRLYCEQNDLTRTYLFEAGKTVTVTGELRLMGADGDNAMLTLASTTEGAKWSIASMGVATVSGVNVSDSNAASGNDIYVRAPSSGLGCDAGWVFNVATSVWTGGGDDNLFTNAANWAGGTAPGEDCIVYVNSSAGISVGDGDGVRALALVIEDGGSATFSGSGKLILGDSLQITGGGTLTADVPIEVVNDVILFSGAKMTCSANGSWDGTTDPASLDYNRVILNAGGNMIVESGAVIDVSGKGFADEHGPGSAKGGGYAGWGFRNGPPGASYGSVFSPMSLGSSGWDDRAGGAVRLAIGGILTLDGGVKANGTDYRQSGMKSYKGSGGSVYITCATLTGSGVIEARGGNFSNDYPGSGGRISVVQSLAADFSAWTGSMTAFGGRSSTDGSKPTAPCGTVFTKSAGANGTILFDNDNGVYGTTSLDQYGYGYGYTDIVSTNYTTDVKSDFAGVTLRLRRGTSVNLLHDLKVKDIEMLSANTQLRLNGNKLKVAARKHELQGSVVEDGGSIEWYTPGMTIIIR